MAKLINDVDAVVRESLEGRVLLQPGLALLGTSNTVVRQDAVVTESNRSSLPVALISGGGAGHEPAHAGYVAEGMLTAAVSGGVFSSPSVDEVLDAIRAVTGDAGCLLIVKSYTGDRLNFGMAAQLARSEGLDVEMVVVGDDVALGDEDSHAGRRGLAGTVLVHKTAGAAAAAGASLHEVSAVARKVAESVGTIGVGFSAPTPPDGEPNFTLEADEMELGLGIHGEPGVERTERPGADELASLMASKVLDDRGITSGQRVVALVGTAGATPPAEIDLFARGVAQALTARGITLERLWAGPVMTSLNAQGAHVSVLAVDDDTLNLLDAQTNSPAWPGRGSNGRPIVTLVAPAQEDENEQELGTPDQQVRTVIDAVCERLVEARDELNAADRRIGDGDLGTALARGAKAWLDNPVDGDATHLLGELSKRCRRDVGGTSGPLYGVMLLGASQVLAEEGTWPDALAEAVKRVQDLGGAQVGDATMVDALVPAAEAAQSDEATIGDVIAAAQEGADSTADAEASKGRASYLGSRAIGHTDPGAQAVVMWLEVIGQTLSS